MIGGRRKNELVGIFLFQVVGIVLAIDVARNIGLYSNIRAL